MGIIKQGDSDSEIIICFGIKFKLSVDLIQVYKFITGFGIYLMWNSTCTYLDCSLSLFLSQRCF